MKYALLTVPHANTRYQASLDTLSLAELQILLGRETIAFERINGVNFLCFEAENPACVDIAARLSSRYVLFAVEGNLVRPIAIRDDSPVPGDISGVLKYKGKTNEMFTALLINLAVFSGAFADQYNQRLCVLDPLCGRGTTLFEALKKGYDASGVELDKKDIDELVRYFKKYLEYHKYKHRMAQNSMTGAGKAIGNRFAFSFAQDAQELKQAPYSLSVTCANASQCHHLFKKHTFHALCADLPYGVQHAGLEGKRCISAELLLDRCLDGWKETLKVGAGVALSFNVHTLSLAKARRILSEHGFRVVEGGPYDALEHWVEQAVTRDVAVAVYE